jgi:hypothetical protein
LDRGKCQILALALGRTDSPKRLETRNGKKYPLSQISFIVFFSTSANDISNRWQFAKNLI